MDIVIIAGSLLLLLAGLLGAFIPVLPGPPLSFAGMLFMHLSSRVSFSVNTLITFGLIALLITLADYLLPIWGTKIGRGSKQGILGASIGLVAGIIFFPPVGVIIGPVAGAWLAEKANGKNSREAFHSAMGSFIGLLLGIVMKFVIAITITWYTLGGLLFSFT